MRHNEDNLQIACVSWFSLQYPSIARLLHHSPNGGKRNAREAARFKRMGVRAGFPDLILLLPSKQYSFLCIELKTKTGKQTDYQKEWQALAESNGSKYIVCRSFDEFQTAIKQYLAL